MKTIVYIALCAALFMLPNYGFSQHGYTQATNMDVNGVFIGGAYTKTQVEAKWGTPTKYRSNTSEHGLIEVYDYSDNQFHFSDNGRFNSFVIETYSFA